MNKIKIIDSIMGSGKTSYSIQKMNEDKEHNYIYITPFLTEIQRIKDCCKDRKFYEPKQMGKGKQDSLHKLIMQNKNIASTHALFQMSTEVTVDLIKANDYILILDEVMNVLKGVDLKKDDLSSLLTLELIIIDDKGVVVWNKDKLDYEGEYDYIKDMALQNTLFYVNKKLFMWTFPTAVFQAFKEVYVMTYMFDSQIQRYYYDLHGLKYEYFYVTEENSKYVLKPRDEKYKEDRTKFKELIDIIDDKINNIGEDDYSLSFNWFNGSKKKNELIKQLKLNIHNYFKRKIQGNSKDNMWTCFKDNKSQLSGEGYTKGFVSCSCRATNDYADKINLAYCVNRFLKPDIATFFTNRNVRIEEDSYALSELLQWIYRSRIRKGEQINIYIPSARMRNLLIEWLYNK